MKRTIVQIDEAKCNGCGLCVQSCHEGAIQLVNGKARLVSESYCDGLGACLPACPTGAITLIEREAAPFDAQAVAAAQAAHTNAPSAASPSPAASVSPLPCGCPGTMARAIHRQKPFSTTPDPSGETETPSELRQWPVQIRLVPIRAPWLEGARLLIAADCTAYAYARIHERFMRGRITLIGCPKLDDTDYAEKLTAMFAQNAIASVTVLRMEVPCCGGLVNAVQRALAASGKTIPWRTVIVTTDGALIEEVTSRRPGDPAL
jgi:NAD-dependent dihydropyrimidine dehydrogenase PreA subunit